MNVHGKGADPRSFRVLTPSEVTLARSMFGAAIDYGAVRLHRRGWWPLQPRGIVMAPDGHMWFHPESPHWCEDFSHAPLHLQGLFLHEMTHIWQAGCHGRWWLPLMRHPFCRYAYRITPGRPFGRYGIEQQAEIVRHAFLLRAGVALEGRPGPAVYERLLPFGRA